MVGLPEGGAAPPLHVWPNPAPDGHFTLTGVAPGTALAVYDALGRLVWRGRANGPQTRVDLSHQPPGVYALRGVVSSGNPFTKRLLK